MLVGHSLVSVAPGGTFASKVTPTIPPDMASAQSSPAWVADVWIAGMVVIVGLVVWMALTGRLLRRRQ